MIRVTLALAVVLVWRLSALAHPAHHSATPAATPEVPLVREIVGAVPVSLQIRNDGDEPDWLIGGSTPIAERVEVHQTRLVEGQRMMGPLAEGLEIPANSTLTLEPGSDHLMLIDLRRGLVQSDTFPLTLQFSRAGTVNVTARVRRRVDAAGVAPIPPVTTGAITVSLVSAPPAPGTPVAG